MKPSLTVLAAFCVITTFAADIPIVENGQPRAVVVLGPALTLKKPSVKSLLDHIERMSDAKLPVVSAERLGEAAVQQGRIVSTDRKASADTFILLGESALTKKLGHTLDGIGGGGIVIKTRVNSITLMGHNDDMPGRQGEADANEVHRFLMTLGVRHLWPGTSGQVIPKMPTLAVGPIAKGSLANGIPIKTGCCRCRNTRPDSRETPSSRSSSTETPTALSAEKNSLIRPASDHPDRRRMKTTLIACISMKTSSPATSSASSSSTPPVPMSASPTVRSSMK